MTLNLGGALHRAVLQPLHCPRSGHGGGVTGRQGSIEGDVYLIIQSGDVRKMADSATADYVQALRGREGTLRIAVSGTFSPLPR